MATGDGTGGTAPGWLARLLGHCWRHRRSVVLALAGAVTGMAALAAVPLLQRAIVDDVILGTGGGCGGARRRAAGHRRGRLRRHVPAALLRRPPVPGCPVRPADRPVRRAVAPR